MGRFVNKGEKAIYILAPVVRRKTEEGGGEVRDRRVVSGFRAAIVFDVSQTAGEPLPAPPEHNATEGGAELLPRLEAAVASFGITLRYEAIPGQAEGYSMGGLIVVEESQHIPARCGTVAHELAHELLHKGTEARREATKQQRELEAEAVAFVVLDHYGMESGSQFYLHGYGITGEMLNASMQIITATARKIIERVDGERTTEDEAGEDPAPPIAA